MQATYNELYEYYQLRFDDPVLLQRARDIIDGLDVVGCLFCMRQCDALARSQCDANTQGHMASLYKELENQLQRLVSTRIAGCVDEMAKM